MVATADTAAQVIDDCRQAAALNRQSPHREGNLVCLSERDGDELLVTGDLHGQRLNFRQLCQIASLGQHPRRHLLMQEVCHGGPTYPIGSGCMSHLLLEDVARLKLSYGHRFHFILSNHEMAELASFPIAKAQKMLNLLFRCGVHQQYGEQTGRVLDAYLDFLGSCPLAIRLPTGVFLCHSAPAGVDRQGFDADIFRRPLSLEDMLPEGAAFRLVWGRDFRRANALAFAELVGADVLIHGHEPCPSGYHVPNEIQIILDSCGPNPCYLLLPLGQRLSQQQIVKQIRWLP